MTTTLDKSIMDLTLSIKDLTNNLRGLTNQINFSPVSDIKKQKNKMDRKMTNKEILQQKMDERKNNPDIWEGVLIEPKLNRITKVYMEKHNLTQMKELVGAERLDLVQIGQHNDLYVDDMGFTKNLDYFLLFGEMFYGNGLILGREGDDNKSTTIDIDLIKKQIIFLT